MEFVAADDAHRTKDARPKSPAPARTWIASVIGLIVGASLAPALFIATAYLEHKGDYLLSFLVGAFLAAGFAIAIISIGLYFVLPRLLKSTAGTLESVVNDLAAAGIAHERNDNAAAITHLSSATSEAIAWYTVANSRRFVTQASFGLLVAFGGIVGSVLLLSQNDLIRQQLKLLEEQNDRLNQATITTDAQRRAALTSELFAIMTEVAKERAESDAEPLLLSDPLAMRIAVLTRSANPYIYIDFKNRGADGRFSLIERPLSPERGQVIVALARARITFAQLHNFGAVFENSDLRDADLSDAQIVGLELIESNLTGAILRGASIRKSRIFNSVLTGISAEKIVFSDSIVSSSNVSNANLEGARIERTAFPSNLSGALLTEAKLNEVDLDFADLDETIIGTESNGQPNSIHKNYDVHKKGLLYVLRRRSRP